MAERRALCGEAERRARAGERPVAIRAALGVGRGTYARWAKQFGFRDGDLSPSLPHAGAPLLHPPGPGGYARSGRFYKGEGLPRDHPAGSNGARHPGWTGGEAVSRAKYAARRDGVRDVAAAQVEMLSAGDLLALVRAALEREEISEADRLLRAWRAKLRRGKTLDLLAGLASAEAAMAGHLPSDWSPGDDVSLAQLWAMEGYDSYRHACALGGEVAVPRADWEAAQASDTAQQAREELTPEDELFEAALARVCEVAARSGWT